MSPLKTKRAGKERQAVPSARSRLRWGGRGYRPAWWWRAAGHLYDSSLVSLMNQKTTIHPALLRTFVARSVTARVSGWSRSRVCLGCLFQVALSAVALVSLAIPGAKAADAVDDFTSARRSMVEDIIQLAHAIGSETSKPTIDERVLDAMARVPRHSFVPQDQRRAAYKNRPLPIGYSQTISQPYIVAVMTHLMNVKPSHTVLEVGTGSGYQAAILAELAKAVYTIEIIEPLAQEARSRLQALGYANVHTKEGDGYYGWEEHGPYDSIIVTAAVSHLPPPLVRQLKAGGRMVIPLGAPFLPQQLMLVEKNPDGSVVNKQILPVQFVPLTGGH